MKAVLLVGAGSIAGSLFRFTLGVLFPDNGDGILVANLVGVALASHILVVMERRGITELRYLLLPGFCAGMTTFSGVTAFVIAEAGISYLLITAALSLALVAMVLPISRKFVKVKR